MKRTMHILLLGGLLGAALSTPSFAESSSGQGGLNLEPGGVESGFKLPAPPTITQSTPPPPQDRQKSQVAAKALGMMGASQAKINCYMMMSEAMKEENKAHKNMMMMMAQQQCAQGDQMMAAAMKNEEGVKLVSGNDIPKQAEMKFQPGTIGQDKIKEAEVPNITFNDEVAKVSSSESAEVPVAAPVQIPDLNQVFNKPSEDLKDPIDKFIETPEPAVSALKPVGAGNVQFDEQKKGPLDNPAAPQLAGYGLGGGVGNGKGTPDDRAGNGARGLTDSESNEDGRRRGRDRTLASAEAPSSGGEPSSGGSSGLDFQALLEQMTGGGAAAGEGVYGELVSFPERKKDEPVPNLFEYASYRYHKLVTEKGAIRRRKIRGIRVPSEASGPRVSNTLTASAHKVDTPQESSK